jgi:hypothetical protein
MPDAPAIELTVGQDTWAQRVPMGLTIYGPSARMYIGPLRYYLAIDTRGLVRLGVVAWVAS